MTLNFYQREQLVLQLREVRLSAAEPLVPRLGSRKELLTLLERNAIALANHSELT